MKDREWKELLGLLNAIRHAEESRLAALARRKAEIETALVRLEDAVELPTDGDGAYLRSGSNMRWQAWCDARKTELHTELAHVRYRQAVQAEVTRIASARSLASEAVLRDAALSAEHLRELRRERDGGG